MNQCHFMGRAVSDPEIRYTQGNNSTCVANFTLAVNRRFKREGEPEADFFRCVAFGKTAEVIEKYVVKATKIVVSGEMQNDNYEKDGVKHYSMKLFVKELEFAESKKAAQENTEQTATDNDGFMPINGDVDMPFA